ncbi:MAG: hypothetical protein ACLR6J_14795 [Parabacteroides merdae]
MPESPATLLFQGKKNTEDCGCCDVCLSKNDSGLNNRDFNAIRDLLSCFPPSGCFLSPPCFPYYLFRRKKSSPPSASWPSMTNGFI